MGIDRQLRLGSKRELQHGRLGAGFFGLLASQQGLTFRSDGLALLMYGLLFLCLSNLTLIFSTHPLPNGQEQHHKREPN